MLVAFLGAVFTAFQFWALMLTLEILVAGASLSIWPVIGVMLVSVAGRTACSYWSTNAETETGYFMVAEKRVHIGDRLRYIPMGYFNDNSLGNITAVVTTTLGDVENNAARCLVSVIGGFLNTLAMSLAILLVDWRLGLLAIGGILAYLLVAELSQRSLLKTGPARQHAQMKLVEAVLEYIQGMSVVKAYGLDKDSGQAVQKTVDESCEKALGLEHSVAPWMGLRQITVRVFAVALAVCALVLYSGGSLPLTRCLLMLVASFMLYAELESAGNMADNLQMLGASMDKANSIDDTPVMDIDGAELRPVNVHHWRIVDGIGLIHRGAQHLEIVRHIAGALQLRVKHERGDEHQQAPGQRQAPAGIEHQGAHSQRHGEHPHRNLPQAHPGGYGVFQPQGLFTAFIHGFLHSLAAVLI